MDDSSDEWESIDAYCDGELSDEIRSALDDRLARAERVANKRGAQRLALTWALKSATRDLPGVQPRPGDLGSVLAAVRSAPPATPWNLTTREAPLGPLVSAFVDGELSSEAAAHVEDRIATDTAGQAALTELRAIQAGVYENQSKVDGGSLERVLAALHAVPRLLSGSTNRRRADSTSVGRRIRLAPAGQRSRAQLRGAQLRGAMWRLAAGTALVIGIGAGLVSLSEPSVSLAYAPGLFASFVHHEVAFVDPLASREPLASKGAPFEGVDLGGVRLGGGALSVKERARLLSGAAVVREQRALLRDGFEGIYAKVVREGHTPLVTTDLAFAMLQRALADTEAILRVERVGPELERLLASVQVRLVQEAAEESNREVADAITRGRRWIEVGQALLSGTQSGADRQVEAELKRIASGRGGIHDTVTGGAPFDYSVLVAGDGAARRIDRALAWFAGSGFALDRPEGARTAVAVVWALLAAEDGEARAITRYERVRRTLDFFHGAPDGPTPHTVLKSLRESKGRSLPRSALGASDASLASWIASVPPPSVPGPARLRPVFTLLGRRAGEAARLSVRLTYPAVSAPEAPRLFGRGLDALAATGAVGAEQALRDVGDLDRPYFTEALADAQLVQGLRLSRLRSTGGDDLYWLFAFARQGLDRSNEDDRGRQLRLGLASAGGLALAPGTGAGPFAAATPPEAGAARSLAVPMRDAASRAAVVEPYPEWFARLASIARATRMAIGDEEAFPSRIALRRRFEALARALDAFAEGARAGIERRAPAPAAAALLGQTPRIVARHLPGPVRGVRVLGVALRAGATPTLRVRVVRGPTLVIRLAAGSPPRAAVGAGLTVRELTTERRPPVDTILRMPLPPPPAWSVNR